jgi:hypothetical protein
MKSRTDFVSDKLSRSKRKEKINSATALNTYIYIAQDEETSRKKRTLRTKANKKQRIKKA